MEVAPSAVKRALQAFDRLHPLPPQPHFVHAWCVCGHQHDNVVATDQPARECGWVFCSCAGFRPRSLGLPSQTERDELTAQLQRTLAEWDEERAREARREANLQKARRSPR
ncbi:hypothetical protein Mx4_p27 [Myxococcus phage Mx4]|nr:hypothetical protein Mx4_p27 [Myxococcus phage Mx4]